MRLSFSPVAVVRCLRDMLVMEDGDGLRLSLGADRAWLASGAPLGVAGVSTHFGDVSYIVQRDRDTNHLRGWIQLINRAQPAWVSLHLRLPGMPLLYGLRANPRAAVLQGEELRWAHPEYRLEFEVDF